MTYAIFDSSLPSGVWGGKLPFPKIPETTGHMTKKFLPEVKYHREGQNPKNVLT